MHRGSTSPALDAGKIEVPSPKEGSNSTNSEAATDTEHIEVSDDDDDDRNHKHRRREARTQTIDENTEEQAAGGPFKRRPRVSGNGQPFGGTDSRGEAQKDFVPKFKRRPGPGAHSRAARANQSFHSASAAGRPPMTRGRGRNGAPWTQHDSRFNTLDMIDFASQMASQGPPAHPNLFMGAALPSGGSGQNGSWGPYGFIPGMPNGILDQIHPLGMQGPIQPAISPLIDLGMSRQRCRDFEERGFCLRGDMCPMEHGVNRIVVEDMQSLSQFNLPVSVPNAPGPGNQNEAGTAHINLNLGGSKGVPAKDNKSSVTDDALKLNGTTAPAVADSDVYDPDQPLWNSEQPEASCAGFAHTNDGVWNAETSSYEAGWEHANHGFAADGLQNSKSSVWGRIASKRKSGPGKTANTTLTNTIGNKRGEYYDEMVPITVQVKPASTKDTNGQSNSRAFGDVGQQNNRASHKASRTLYVNGIPQESNRWEALLSHFQKFGQVIDIYIPSNSEKAFVQFSKREEAEAALKAPDAVMGNRFIKLWWANRDRITDGEDGRISAKSSQSSTLLTNSALPQPSSNRGKDLQSTIPRASSGPSAEASGHGTGPKILAANSITSIPPAPKRQESLELLEEIRKKQEMLAQKRDEFRRHLEKLAKQKSSPKSSKQAEADGKEVLSNAVGKVADIGSMSARTEGPQEVIGTLEKKNSGELSSSSAKAAPTSTQKPAVATKQATPLLAPPQNRFKLDNRTTSFRILPPLPPEIANEPALKDHFALFGELSSVVLEDTEAHNHDATLKPSLSCSACVTYTTRQSAEKAFMSGKSCKGHMLRFMWLTASPGSNQSRPQKTSISVMVSGTSGQTQNTASEFPSPVGKFSSTATSSTAANPRTESTPNAESAPTFPVGYSKVSSSSSSLSSNIECPPEHDATRNAVLRDSDVPQ